MMTPVAETDTTKVVETITVATVQDQGLQQKEDTETIVKVADSTKVTEEIIVTQN